MQNKILALIAASLFCLINTLSACTGIFQKAKNGDYVYARTMEFGQDLLTFDLLYVPRGIHYTSELSKGAKGTSWEAKYAHVGFSPYGMPILADGLNEKGLAAGAFYFPGWASYQVEDEKTNASSIANIEFISWVLGNFSSVNEVKEALKSVKVVGVVFESWDIIPPLHYFIADASGESAVIEYINGHLHIYKSPIHTITNSPNYSWHTTNARNYIGLRALNDPAIKIDGLELSQFGQGSGALGLPGDFTPPSRFIRAAFLNAVVLNEENGSKEVKRAFKILNQFDIPKGSIREISNGKEHYDITQWTAASDLASKRYFFHTYQNRDIRFVDLKALDPNAKKIKSISVGEEGVFEDISKQLKS